MENWLFIYVENCFSLGQNVLVFRETFASCIVSFWIHMGVTSTFYATNLHDVQWYVSNIWVHVHFTPFQKKLQKWKLILLTVRFLNNFTFFFYKCKFLSYVVCSRFLIWQIVIQKMKYFSEFLWGLITILFHVIFHAIVR